MLFKDLGLMPELLSAIAAYGYKTATPIQAQTIPTILKGNDILAGAQTGTGKTAAFALPILQILNAGTNRSRNPRTLILTPTRELAAQILDFIESYGKELSLRSTVVFGGVSINPQKKRLMQGIDILVATPGRLLDHLRQKTLNLSQIEILVLDEADRMLDMGFVHDIRKILRFLPQKRQNLLFSATYSNDIKMLASRMLDNPKLIEVETKNTTADTVSQVAYPVDRKRKKELLSKLIREEEWRQVLVFTRTKHGANKLSKQLLKDKIEAVAIHGNKSQGARTRALADFKNGDVKVLVATDIAARGLDISLLPYVVNYELPEIPESYVHRIGRTGRAGVKGKAISFISPEDHKELRGIHKLLTHKIPIQIIEGFEVDLNIIPQKPDSKQRANNARNAQRPDKKSTRKPEKFVKSGPKKNEKLDPKKRELKGKRIFSKASPKPKEDTRSSNYSGKQGKKSVTWKKQPKADNRNGNPKRFSKSSRPR